MRVISLQPQKLIRLPSEKLLSPQCPFNKIKNMFKAFFGKNEKFFKNRFLKKRKKFQKSFFGKNDF